MFDLRRNRWLLLVLLVSCSLPNTQTAEQPAEGEEKKCVAFGIDLGTTFSALALCYDGKCEIVKNQIGNSITPSVVYYDENGRATEVGEAADHLGDQFPERTIRWAKNLIGRQLKEAQAELKHLPYKVEADKNGMAVANINGVQTSFPKISSEVLKKMDQLAKSYLKMRPEFGDPSEYEIKYAITVPAYFNQPKRKATKDAAVHAGLNLLSLFSEPVAATLTMLDTDLSTTVVVDIGGGTTDITVQRVEDGVYITKATNGAFFGGSHFDLLIMEELKKKIKGEKIDDSKLLKLSEQIKIHLSSEDFYETDYGMITKHRFNQLLREAGYVSTVIGLIKTAIEKSGYGLDEIDYILLVGGSARIPIWKEVIEREFTKNVIVSSNPDHAIALGAAQLAAQMCGHGPENKVVITTVSHGYAVKAMQGRQELAIFIIKENTNVPVTLSQTFSTAVDNQPEVDVEILQGFDKNVSNNQKIGNIRYQNLPLRRAGQVQVEVTFKVSEDQIMTATVKGLYPGAETQELAITLDENIEPEEIERRKKEASQQADLFNYIIEIENKLSDAHYAVESTITKEMIQDSHINFVKDLLKEWSQAKSTHTDAEALKAYFDPKIEKAMPILEEVSKAKAEALKTYDEKHPDSAAQPGTATPEDL